MTRYDWAVLAATLALVLSTSIIATGPSGGLIAALTHPATAGWMQAIGSFAAVVTALWLAREEAKARRRGEDAARQRQLQVNFIAASTAAAYLTSSLTLADKRSREGGWSRGAPRVVLADLEGALGALKALPLGELSNREMSLAVVNLMQVGHAALVFLRIIDEDVDRGVQVDTQLFSSLLIGASEARARLQSAAASSAAEAAEP